jgi:hypothetical protein
MRTVFVLAVLVPSVVVADGRVAPAGAAPREVLRGDVLVWDDARLYVEPDVTGPSLQLATLDAPRAERPGHAFAMHVVSTPGPLVEVEPASGFDCAWSRLGAGPLAKLRLFVKREDLAPVVIARATTTFKDRTSIDLWPGTPVVAVSKGTYAIGLFGDEPIVAIPASKIGHAYTPKPPTREEALVAAVSGIDSPPYDVLGDASSDRFAVKAQARVTLGGQSFTLRTRSGAWTTETVTPSGALRLFTLHTHCARVRVAASAEDVVAWSPPAWTAPAFDGSGILNGSAYYIVATSPLQSASGRQVAIAKEPIGVPEPKGAATSCADLALGLDSIADAPADVPAQPADATLHVCARAAQVGHVDPTRRHYENEGAKP